ncbi:MAG: hypothetical protein C0595_09565 [Marinilabiliales bacterium]|nr:MAG: hypothetical protein C0595_09565 [Marinilabiliales bacterium]
MNQIRLITLLVVITGILFLSCNKTKDGQFKVAMLAEGNTFDDLSFLQSCKEGMERAKTDFNLSVEYNIDTTTNMYQQRINNFASQDYELIIAIGYMWNDAILEAANSFPDTKFILVDNELSETRNNVVSIVFDVDEAAFPIGFLSAWWAESQGSDSPKTACIGALKIPQIRQFIEPFNNGVNYYNSIYTRSVDTSIVYAGNFFDSELGVHLSDSLINEGADIIFGVGSETASGALLKAKQRNIWGVGTDVDQFYSFPEVADFMLTTAEKGLDNSIYEVVKSFTEKKFNGGSTYHGNLENLGVAIAPYHNADAVIADSIKTKVESIKTEITMGNISTGW